MKEENQTVGYFLNYTTDKENVRYVWFRGFIEAMRAFNIAEKAGLDCEVTKRPLTKVVDGKPSA